MVETGRVKFLVDCGPTAQWALMQEGFDPPEVPLVFITHFHGDHVLGLIMKIVSHQYRHPGEQGMTVYGPEGIEDKVKKMYGLVYASGAEKLDAMGLLRFGTLRPSAFHSLHEYGLTVQALPMNHSPESLGYRFVINGKVLAFSGDTGWTDSLIELSQGADLLVTECSFYELDFPNHLSYTKIKAHLSLLKARQIVLSHLGDEMIGMQDKVEMMLAHDGLVLEV